MPPLAIGGMFVSPRQIAARPQALDREGVALGDEVGEGGEPGRGESPDEVAVLRRVGDAVQR
jgi:hypothetical protein